MRAVRVLRVERTGPHPVPLPVGEGTHGAMVRPALPDSLRHPPNPDPEGGPAPAWVAARAMAVLYTIDGAIVSDCLFFEHSKTAAAAPHPQFAAICQTHPVEIT